MDQPHDVITSDRFELPLLTRDELAALRRGEPDGVAEALHASISTAWLDEVRWLAGMRWQQLGQHPDHAPWLLRAIVLRDAERPAIGHLNFHAPPDERGVPEVGYSLLPEFRGKGYAIEAVHALFDWAHREHGVSRFRASVAPDNDRSQNLIRKLGFGRVGEQWDPEDGLEWVFEAEWPPHD
ncbi:MAG TPA: GNAT family N-acetyltransferase [Candidatus Limnocylindria bacterium]|nr:GNAT family N-acetyltransferase [Candidatus Limnocylindria bacterium]